MVLLQDSIGSLLKLDPAPGRGGGVLPLLAKNASESLMSASTALLTLLGQNTRGLYTVLKSRLHNVVMTSFAVMQLCPIVRMIIEGKVYGNSQV